MVSKIHGKDNSKTDKEDKDNTCKDVSKNETTKDASDICNKSKNAQAIKNKYNYEIEPCVSLEINKAPGYSITKQEDMVITSKKQMQEPPNRSSNKRAMVSKRSSLKDLKDRESYKSNVTPTDSPLQRSLTQGKGKVTLVND